MYHIYIYTNKKAKILLKIIKVINNVNFFPYIWLSIQNVNNNWLKYNLF